MKVEIYPVGWLAGLRRSWRHLTMPAPGPAISGYKRRHWWHHLRWQWRYMTGRVRRGNWRAVKNSFNGYLAEPDEFPPGDYRRRCGSGWTKARALRSLYRRLP